MNFGEDVHVIPSSEISRVLSRNSPQPDPPFRISVSFCSALLTKSKT